MVTVVSPSASWTGIMPTAAAKTAREKHEHSRNSFVSLASKARFAEGNS